MDLYLCNLLHAHPASLELLGEDPGAKFETFSSTEGIYEGLYNPCAKHKSVCKFHLEAKIEKILRLWDIVLNKKWRLSLEG